MKKFSKAIKEYKHDQTINGTKQYLVRCSACNKLN